MTPASALLYVLLALSALFDLWVIGWQFSDLLNAAITPVDYASSAVLAKLAPTNYDEQMAYRKLLSLGVLAMAFGFFKAARMASRRGERLKPLLMAAAVGTTIFTVVVLDVPYRIVWQSEGERVMYQNTICHVIATRGESLRLFCGSRTPRSLVISGNDPNLVRSGTPENIFTPFSRADSR